MHQERNSLRPPAPRCGSSSSRLPSLFFLLIFFDSAAFLPLDPTVENEARGMLRTNGRKWQYSKQLFLQ